MANSSKESSTDLSNVANPQKETPAGPRIEYTGPEKWVAAGLAVYLVAAFGAGLWLILDVWTERFLLLNLMGFALPNVEKAAEFLQLVVYAMAGGWLGGVISAARSLQEHYTAPVEYVCDLKKQEENRFHMSWWSRWFWGPWQGMALALIVIALLRAGVLVFAAFPSDADPGTMSQNFATFGLGALVGVGAKEVFEKLDQTLKAWLKVEEPEARKFRIMPPDQVTEYGGKAIAFTVEPAIPAEWAIDPAGDGTIINGIFRPAQVAPASSPKEHIVIVTAISKADTDRSASTTFVLKANQPLL